ncbi:hypothetical protein FA10DRAFT_79329 [Acaromyces ingoldii]|uniref:Uncharacterized protein n=1 Tax=Acaromyces ingoldii TaxID=215250 RepID=A0A316YRV8_9BASI|nr:hypothetical protein FA10DRAFT_79329 [Acaromyces ingoldii]PWN91971.1 hypothetical protein FA10DRAFT_79329 [Acaromyces ingoldii]
MSCHRVSAVGGGIHSLTFCCLLAALSAATHLHGLLARRGDAIGTWRRHFLQSFAYLCCVVVSKGLSCLMWGKEKGCVVSGSCAKARKGHRNQCKPRPLDTRGFTLIPNEAVHSFVHSHFPPHLPVGCSTLAAHLISSCWNDFLLVRRLGQCCGEASLEQAAFIFQRLPRVTSRSFVKGDATLPSTASNTSIGSN